MWKLLLLLVAMLVAGPAFAVGQGPKEAAWPDNTVTKSVFWRADEIVSDGVQCAAHSDVQINSGPEIPTIVCADNDASIIEGETAMPYGWNGGSLIFEIHYVQTAADTAQFSADVDVQCCENSAGTVDNSYGTPVALDDASVSGSNKIDTVTSAAVTPSGTCSGDSDWIFWRISLDAAGTTTAVATLNIVGVTMKYTWVSDDEETIATNTGTDFQADANCQGLWLNFTNGAAGEDNSEINRCDATGATDMVWAGAGWAHSTAPVGTDTGYDSVDITKAASEWFALTDAAGEADAFEAAEFVAAAWINKDLSAGSEAFMSKNDTDCWEVTTTVDDKLLAEVNNDGEASAINLLAVGDWHHVAMRRTNATAQVEIFIDGVEVCDGACNGAAAGPTGNTDDLRIGAGEDDNWEYDGQIMNVIYLDRVLTDTEMAELFLCGPYGTADGTLRDMTYGGATCATISDSCCN